MRGVVCWGKVAVAWPLHPVSTHTCSVTRDCAVGLRGPP